MEEEEKKIEGRQSRPGRAFSWALLIAGTVAFLLLLAAMVEENFLSQWRNIQRHYRSMLIGSEDAGQRELGEEFTVELRQVDLPQFSTVDRCVTCHLGIDNPGMKDAGQPFRMHPGDYLDAHPPSRFGCTICHRGQGPATDFEEAKAVDAFWNYPLLPAGLTESSCGACHAPASDLMKEHAPKLAMGRRLFLDRGCGSCHKLDGVGGQLGPALDAEGLKTRHQLPMVHVRGEHTLGNWLGRHFEDPQRVVENSEMPPPRLTPEENEALTVYMLSLQDRDLPRTYIAPDRVSAWNERLHGKTNDPEVLYGRYCLQCHGDGTYGRWSKFFRRFMPAVRGPGLRAAAEGDYLRSAVSRGRPGTLMSGWDEDSGGLTQDQVDVLVEYLARGGGRSQQVLRPVPKNLAGGDAERGGQLYGQLCLGCHGPAGKGDIAPALANPSFLAAAGDSFLALTIVNGRTATAMPAFQKEGASGLTDGEIRHLVAYIRSLESGGDEKKGSGHDPE